MRKLFLLILIPILLTGCPSDDTIGSKSLCIKNKSDKEMFFWFSYDFPHHHFPDTILPVQLPLLVRGAGSGGCVGSNAGYSPSWETIFSELPEGLFSVYFFETYPENQEDWDELRENMEELIYRKDTSFEELEANDYIIEYP
ncbi:MAG TPA: hypothetical protein VFD80_00510 [Flavobacteriaceae bacterium]|nr:hypothetical protein [Flavobacteriaceae bacterium]